MPIYESAELTREDLKKLRKRNVCAICGANLNMYYDSDSHRAFVACWDYPRTQHEGIAKEYEYRELNIVTRREQMVQQIGVDKARQLARYQGVTSLSRQEAMEILETIWPDAPPPDKLAAAILCSSYGLNPLANHVFLIPFKDKDGKQTWARVWGIKAKRLLASRKGGYSYLDMSPRLMTEAEQIKVWGAVDTAHLCYLTWLKDMVTGAEVYGYGKWPIAENPYGAGKGNSKANMASIRSESQAIDRLRPAEMPTGFAVADEQYIDGEGRVVVEGEVTELASLAEATPTVPKTSTRQAGKDKTRTSLPPGVKQPANAEEGNPPELVGKINRQWLIDSVNKVKMDALKYIKDTYHLTASPKDSLFDMVGKLSEEQQAAFVKEIEDRLKMV